MATQDSSGSRSAPSRLNLVRCALTGAVALGAVFVLCWVGTAAGMAGSSHMFISLFTAAPVASAEALGLGLCWALVFGGVSGAFIAAAYTNFGFLDRA